MTGALCKHFPQHLCSVLLNMCKQPEHFCDESNLRASKLGAENFPGSTCVRCYLICANNQSTFCDESNLTASKWGAENFPEGNVRCIYRISIS
ncbi:hypothetical protein CEXT_292781 [Caerostris extrusa]|uniref:Secreted protein n=1 Tax=Caerostris extrusa TaxID=172846 RepID=A0AAV4YCN0_CAEEX|nr:hypothetical protein CEXT_292781 [Caerostris extrusa]